ILCAFSEPRTSLSAPSPGGCLSRLGGIGALRRGALPRAPARRTHLLGPRLLLSRCRWLRHRHRPGVPEGIHDRAPAHSHAAAPRSARLVLLSHAHPDPLDAATLSTFPADCVILCPEPSKKYLGKVPQPVRTMRPGDSYAFPGGRVIAVVADHAGGRRSKAD